LLRQLATASPEVRSALFDQLIRRAEQRDDLASFQLTEIASAASSQGDVTA